MEGKAALFKRFAGIDAWPICLDTQDTEEIIRTVKAIAPGFAGINLEDISAPRCFEIERRLREAPGHPGLPRRPARHRDRGAGRADQRAAGGRQGDRPTCGSSAPARARPARRSCKLLLRRGRKHITVADYPRRGARRARGPRRSGLGPALGRREHQPRRLHRHAARGAGRRGRLHRRLRAEHPDRGRHRRRWPTARSCSRWPTPTPRWTRRRRRSTPRWSPPAAATSRTRSTTCWCSPGSSAACWTRSAARSAPRCCCGGARAGRRGVDDELNAELHRAERLPRQGGPAVAAAVREAATRPGRRRADARRWRRRVTPGPVLGASGRRAHGSHAPARRAHRTWEQRLQCPKESTDRHCACRMALFV